MPRVKVSTKKKSLNWDNFRKWLTTDEIRAKIFSEPIPQGWRKGQFVFNRASMLYGDNFVRSVGYDPFYNDENINPFIESLTAALNNLN